MKKKKRIILGSAIGFIALICLQIFSTGHGHVVVVEKNEVLTESNEKLTTANKTLTKSVTGLKAKNEALVEEKAELAELVTEISGSLDSTKQAAEELTKELKNEKDINLKQSTGEQFDFQPIQLPASDNN
jgi:uncharacterized protein YydD (DUF2326 family)